MSPTKRSDERHQDQAGERLERHQTFDLQYAPAEDVHPLELVGNAQLALHHHMAPADGGFDIAGEDD